MKSAKQRVMNRSRRKRQVKLDSNNIFETSHTEIISNISSLPKLRELQSLALESTNYDYESAEYRVTAIILDTAHYRLF